MLKRILGLDLGISSIGWAITEIDDLDFVNNNGEVFLRNGKIVDCGVRIFDACEQPGNKHEASALPRRNARLNRRRLFRKSARCKKIRELCEKQFNFKKTLDKNDFKDVWILRKEALERKLNEIELSRVLCHIVKHRGWASRRKSEEKEGDSGKMKTAIDKLKQELGDDKTPGYYYGKLKAESLNYDNEKIINEHQNYDHCIGRSQNEFEIKKIFEKQRKFGFDKLDNDFENEVLKLFNYEKETKSIKDMIGFCLFEKGEFRAPKESYSAELFNVYTKINNLKVLDTKDVDYDKKFNSLVELFKTKKEVKYKDIRKELKLDDNYKFKGLDYYQAEYVEFKKAKNSTELTLSNTDKNNIEKYKLEGFFIEEPDKARKVFFKNDKGEYKYKSKNDIENVKIYSMVGYHKVKDVLNDDEFKKYIEKDKDSPFIIDTIMEALSYEKNDEKSKKYMQDHNIPEDIIDKCLNVQTSNFIHISCKAIRNLLPYLEKGLTYDKACLECKYEFKDDSENNQQDFLPTLEEYTKENDIAKLTNPVVKRTLSQTRKVINAIIRKYGNFDQINIEFTRDLGKSADERIKIERGQKEFRDLKEELKKEASLILHVNEDVITDKQILKLRLYKQQEGKSLYSNPLEKLPDLKEILTDDKCCEIDHILPYSKSFDDSLNNKVLVLPKENQNKQNRIPFEYLKDSNWEEWKKIIWSIQSLPYIKRKNLTTESYDFVDKWKARNLCDTSYISKYLVKYLSKSLKFKENDKIKNKIQVRPGQLTSYLRHIWGLGEKIRSDGDTHHVVDAIIVACATQSMCQMISALHATQRNEDVKQQQKEIFDKINQLKSLSKTKKIEEKIKKLEEESKWYNLIESRHILEGHCKLNGIWENFVSDVDKKVNNLTKTNETTGLPEKNQNIVSRMPRRKITGEAHDATIKGLDKVENITYTKTKLSKLTLKNIENLQDKDGASKNLYNILKNRLEKFNGDAEKAFKEPIYMTNKNGEYDENKTPQIKSVKLVSNYTGGGVEVNNGIAQNGGMPRVDIFYKDNKYYAVPIYIADFVKDKLPTLSKPHNIDFPIEEKEDDKFYNKHFVFSLYKDELIYIEHVNGGKFFGYFVKYALNQNQGQFCLEKVDKSPFGISIEKKTGKEKIVKEKQIDINCIKILKKFQVDPLGYINEVKQEKRQGIIEKKCKKQKN